ncbi:2-dehydro-3-deoxyphosphogluconate aldolase [Kribbella sp. NPDC003505]|uniref:bifunctional 4-hydroxy-2-oxoglutarate aldolase/2-dehydro-3-deoxy-phosphogluconate aldolase n=1 Tax=Kribbella sp. NPDC003505 TaxID=3154448 RepID=UPI0033B4C6DA
MTSPGTNAFESPSGVVAIVRLKSPAPDEIADVLADAGVRFVEITLGTPECLATLQRWRTTVPMRVGAGSVRRPSQVADALAAGAQFLVTPTTRPEVLASAVGCSVPIACGALTPSEIESAYESGASLVKVFPVHAIGGPDYIRAVRAPMPDVPLMPVGNCSVDVAAVYAGLGCAAVGIGSGLVNDEVIAQRNWAQLHRLARAYVAAWDDSSTGGDS